MNIGRGKNKSSDIMTLPRQREYRWPDASLREVFLFARDP